MVAELKAPECLTTARLILRRPTLSDAERIFGRYAHDPEATRYLSWPRHRSVEQSRGFVELSDCQWKTWPAGPYLIESRESGVLLGGTGLSFETLQVASTGYVLARDAWGNGYATEALGTLVTLSESIGLRWLFALCHHKHVVSQRVLEKCRFYREQTSSLCAEFPNFGSPKPQKVVRYVYRIVSCAD